MFAGKGITSNMAPEEAVQNIKSLLISSTEKGSQDHCSLLECYKLFDKYLTNSGRNSGGAGGGQLLPPPPPPSVNRHSLWEIFGSVGIFKTIEYTKLIEKITGV